jgi:photosystem II stability/assembly factor-like uncharacterized protein
MQSAATSARFQAVSVVSERVAWISGVEGTYARTTDGGETWTSGVVPGADTLQFRDVHAVDAQAAYLLAAGPGARSRIYKTTNGGQTWTILFTNSQPEGFFDCLDFWSPTTGVAFSDQVNGRFIIMRTTDGYNWSRVPQENVPAALPGEGSFAASGTCLVTYGDSSGWIGTGASDTARVLMSTDRGWTWSVAATPIVSGEVAGIASVAFRDTLHGVAAGGDIGSPETFSDNIAVTLDGGHTWQLAGRPTFSGAVYGTAYVPGADVPTLVAVGPKGASYSLDDGTTWTSLDTLNYWGLGFASPDAGWLVGPDGRIVKVSLY